MIDKQKQIEEIAKYCCNACEMCCDYGDCAEKGKDGYKNCGLAKETAEKLYNAGYRKIPENTVVLTREEYETYTFIKRKWGNQDAIKRSELVDGLYEFAREFSKETAEKISDKVHRKMEPYMQPHTLYSQAEKELFQVFLNKLDEICKEITDKGVQNGD